MYNYHFHFIYMVAIWDPVKSGRGGETDVQDVICVYYKHKIQPS